MLFNERWWEELLQTSSSPRSSNWTAPTSRTSSTRWTLQNFWPNLTMDILLNLTTDFWPNLTVVFPPARVANGGPGTLGAPIWLCHGSHPHKQVSSYIQLQELIINPLSGWTQAQYARSLSVQFGESVVDYLHCTNSAINHLVLALRNISIRPKDTLKPHFEWPRNL